MLIVDDNAPMRATIRFLLADRPLHAVECEDGVQAVEAYERLHPEWVLMDVAMPRLDGIAATKAIHAMDAHARIVLVTEYGDDTVRNKALEAGACAVVTKDDLFRLLDIVS